MQTDPIRILQIEDVYGAKLWIFAHHYYGTDRQQLPFATSTGKRFIDTPKGEAAYRNCKPVTIHRSNIAQVLQVKEIPRKEYTQCPTP